MIIDMFLVYRIEVVFPKQMRQAWQAHQTQLHVNPEIYNPTFHLNSSDKRLPPLSHDEPTKSIKGTRHISINKILLNALQALHS